MAETSKETAKKGPATSAEKQGFRVKSEIRHPRTQKVVIDPVITFERQLYILGNTPKKVGRKTAVVPDSATLKRMYDTAKGYAVYIEPPEGYVAAWER